MSICQVILNNRGSTTIPKRKNTAKFNNYPFASEKLIRMFPASLTMYTNTKPPIKAAINPLPLNSSAIRNVSTAIAKNVYSLELRIIHSLSRAFKTNQPLASPTTSPTNIPKPICWKATWTKYPEGLKASAAKPMAIKTRKK